MVVETIKHLTGLCGEAHPNVITMLTAGGFIVLIKIKNIITDLWN